MVTGHFSADHVARFQPMKFAAIEGLWKHEDGPAGLIVFARPQSAAQVNRAEIKIPYAMSVLTGYGLSGSPRGIREEVAEQEDKILAAGAAAGSAGPRGAAAVCVLVAADLRPRPRRNRIAARLANLGRGLDHGRDNRHPPAAQPTPARCRNLTAPLPCR
jgi:cytochrome bd-type quinol oxidase subunit 1